jgi:biotin operon repressor
MEIAKEMKIVLLLLKDFSRTHTITSIGKELGMTRSGTWKVLKRLEKEKYIIMEGTGKETSLIVPKLNFKNDLLDKYLNLVLSKEAKSHERWIFNFKEVQTETSFFILHGSILYSPKEANDIDVIGVISTRQNFKKLHKTIDQIQKSQLKHIHAINFTQTEFRQELLKPNRAFIDALKKGIVLFGQENFIMFIKKIKGVQK